VAHRLRLGTLALIAFAAVAVAAGCGGGGGSGGNAQTAAQLRAQEIQVGTFNRALPGEDPDEMDRSGLDLTDEVRILSPGHYELVVQNFSNVGFINSFWFHSPSLRISKVVSTTSGTCVLEDSSTLNCQGMKIAPPKCTCQTGGIVRIRFDAKPLIANHGVDGGIAVHDMTPVPYHIPSYLNPQQNLADLPLCKPGQVNTKAHPCVHGA
jgi:hypothetical protein